MQTMTVVTPHRYLSPKVTWTAIVTGVVSIAVAVAPVASALVGLHNPIATLIGSSAADKVSAACSLIAAISTIVAGRGRSIDPAVDAGKATTAP